MVRLELALADDTAFGLMHQGAALQGDELTLHASGIANGATLLLTGGASEHRVRPCTQDKSDREQARGFHEGIDKGTLLATKGAVDDATSGDAHCSSGSARFRDRIPHA